jgi:hypothetical protein
MSALTLIGHYQKGKRKASVGEDVERKLSHTAGVVQIGRAILENSMQVLKKIKNRTTYFYSTTCFLPHYCGMVHLSHSWVTYPQEMKSVWCGGWSHVIHVAHRLRITNRH